MSPLPGRRAGMAILSVEIEEATPGRVLIRVRTVDDVVEEKTAGERAFASPSQAIEYLHRWLDAWVGGER